VRSVTSAHAKTTQAVYNSKWTLFASFCHDRFLDAFGATSAQVAEFLHWLFHERQLSTRTIQGYRSAIAAQLKAATGYDPGTDPVLTRLLRSFQLERPFPVKTVVKWDVSLVLDYLKHGRLQHTTMLTPRDLTLKTVFLLALATGKRRGELHALSPDLHKVNDTWDAISLRPRLDFLGKTHFRTQGRGTFKDVTIPALPNEEGTLAGVQALCPVHALRVYKQVSDKYRSANQKRLIISFIQSRSADISAQSISNYLKWLVQDAYAASADTPALCQKYQMTPHDVRGVATSLKACSKTTMAELMQAGTWSSMDTFLKFYVKEFTCNDLTKLYELGPFVSAGSQFG